MFTSNVISRSQEFEDWLSWITWSAACLDASFGFGCKQKKKVRALNWDSSSQVPVQVWCKLQWLGCAWHWFGQKVHRLFTSNLLLELQCNTDCGFDVLNIARWPIIMAIYSSVECNRLFCTVAAQQYLFIGEDRTTVEALGWIRVEALIWAGQQL